MSRIAGLALVAVLMVLVAAFPAARPGPRPAEDPGRRRHRRLGRHRRPARHAGGDRRRCARAATRWTPRSPRPACSASPSRTRAASAAAASSSSTTPGITRSTRSTAARPRPPRMRPDSFATRHGAVPLRLRPRVGGLSVGVPGTVAGWQRALNRYGTRSLDVAAAARRADRPPGLHDRPDLLASRSRDNAAIFDDFPATAELYLTPAATAKPVGAVQTNPDLARTYERIARATPTRFYSGGIARDIVADRPASAASAPAPTPHPCARAR